MNYWWQGTTLVLATLFGIFGGDPLSATSSSNILQEVQTTKNRRMPIVAQQNLDCSQFAANYTKVYAFETQRFCISIYQADNDFFYFRQSKADPEELLILPATAVFGGTIFQAIDGKTVYFVGLDANGYYSSVMRNNDEVVFEPEIQPSMVDLPKNERSKHTLTENIPFLTDSHENDPDARVNQFKQETDWKNCTQDEKINPLINSWQKLIGTSTTTANNCQIPAELN
ncbi:hypothetical protein [Myxosarcina sp. GI1]|uniref:hypothetical protein n=1 Tax=Myxosarcina sp. GI1 TaxID=1541065 RepID=UPI0005696A9C|nr:hypothetical protein [Myxosarcina sp. GI1]